MRPVRVDVSDIPEGPVACLGERLEKAGIEMRTRTYYLLLSALTGFVELGAVVFGIREGWSPAAIFLVVLGYHTGGALLNIRHDFRWHHFQIAVCAGLVLAALLPNAK